MNTIESIKNNVSSAAACMVAWVNDCLTSLVAKVSAFFAENAFFTNEDQGKPLDQCMVSVLEIQSTRLEEQRPKAVPLNPSEEEISHNGNSSDVESRYADDEDDLATDTEEKEGCNWDFYDDINAAAEGFLKMALKTTNQNPQMSSAQPSLLIERRSNPKKSSKFIEAQMKNYIEKKGKSIAHPKTVEHPSTKFSYPYRLNLDGSDFDPNEPAIIFDDSPSNHGIK